jgi:thiol:disulfide interchange protein DsbC
MKQVVAMRDDIAFYIKLFPLVSIHPEAYAKSQAIMCEKDNGKALKLLEDAFEKKPLPEATCSGSIIDEHMRLGRSLELTGTPALIFQSGKKASGALKANDIVQRAMEKKI